MAETESYFHKGGPTEEWVINHIRVEPDNQLTPEEANRISRILGATVERTGSLWINPEVDCHGLRANGTNVNLDDRVVRCVSGQKEEAFFAVK